MYRKPEIYTKKARLVGAPFLWLSVIAAAAKNDNDSKDDDPSAVVIKEMAEAVVIHYVFLRKYS